MTIKSIVEQFQCIFHHEDQPVHLARPTKSVRSGFDVEQTPFIACSFVSTIEFQFRFIVDYDGRAFSKFALAFSKSIEENVFGE